MQEPLKTMSPLTTPKGNLQSHRGMAIALVLIAIIAAGVVIFLVQNKKGPRYVPLTNEQKAEIVAGWEKEEVGSTLTHQEREAIVESQNETTSPGQGLTNEQRAEIINSMQ